MCCILISYDKAKLKWAGNAFNTHRPGREHSCRGYSLNITECTIQSYFLSVSCIKVFKSHTATGGWGKLWPTNAGPLGGRLEVAVWDLKNFIQLTDKKTASDCTLRKI